MISSILEMLHDMKQVVINNQAFKQMFRDESECASFCEEYGLTYSKRPDDSYVFRTIKIGVIDCGNEDSTQDT